MSTRFTPTPAELSLVTQIFNQADPQKLGILTGDVAVKVFGGAKLPPTTLGEIWSIADEDNNGWLPRKGVAIAIRLMGWAQKGEQITQELVNKPGPLPTIEGYAFLAQQATGTSTTSSVPGIPLLTPQEKVKFQTMFTRSGPDANGLLNGNKARDIFVKSKLNNDTLLQVWNLADTQDRGALDSTDFAIGMYFIQGLMSGKITSVPTTLPPGLYQQAGGNPASNQGSVRSQMTGNSGSFSPISSVFPQTRSTLQPQYTGQSQFLQPDHTGLSAAPPKPPNLPARPNPVATSPFAPQRNGHTSHWDVTPTEKANADKFFDELDIRQRGYIEGEVAVPFMLKSNLPGEDLARIWDLTDINGDGRLTRDGFAVAMYLIQKKLAGVEIPQSLSHSLIPPSMRNSVSSPFSSPFQQQSLEPTRDLLWDDTPPASATTSQPARPAEMPTSRSVSDSVPTHRDPFGSSAFTSPPSHQDLLGDDDAPEHTSPPLQDQSAEIGNTQNQLSSTNRALDTLKSERAQVEERLTNQTSQLSSLQNQLTSAKTAYELETKTLATLRERYSTQAIELQRLTEQLIHAESDLSAVRVEKAEVEGAFMRDREDTRELQRKMADVGQQIELNKVEVEKAKKDAKQQKGLLAIARKQLSVKEAERAKSEKELEQAAAEVASITDETNTAESELAALSVPPAPLRADSVALAAAHPLPSSPVPSSPAGSMGATKSNNPFDKLNKSGGTPQSHSPFLPFAGLSTPIPGTDAPNGVDQTSSFDPFGFSDAFEMVPQPASENAKDIDVIKTISRPETPKPAPVEILSPNAAHSVLSPGTEGDSDLFVTPPTTAPLQPSETSRAVSLKEETPPGDAYPAMDDAASKFPELDSGTSKAESAPNSQSKTEPDFGSRLDDLDVDESESDSEDEVPLADLAAKTHKPAPAVSTPTASTKPETSSFDNIFNATPPFAGVVPPHQPSTSVTSNLDSPGSPIRQTSGVPAKDVSGVSAFDEAMWTIPAPPDANKQPFTFDSNFEDNFDFASASSKPAVSSPTGIANGNNAQPSESLFSAAVKNQEPVFSANGRSHESSPNGTTSKPTFDEAFAAFDSGPSLALDSSFVSSISKDANAVTEASPARAVSPSPASPQPNSPPTVRTKSPPPRTSSPKPPRPSTSSSKETHEKVEKAPTRHSKLSIRLPFGKKKKQQQQPEPLPPTPVQYLTPPREEPSGTITPALDDDVEAVKQLSAMGFSRSQAINALEKYGYDVQRALNSLLGAP